MAGTAPGTAVGISTDMKSGLIDRFRSLPISAFRCAGGPGAGGLMHSGPRDRRPCADRARRGLGESVDGLADALAAVGLSLLIAFSMTWAGACAGMFLANPEAAQAWGFIVFLPLSFALSNAFVPTQGIAG